MSKCRISVWGDHPTDPKVMGHIQTAGGRARATTGAKQFMLPELMEPGTQARLTPKDGDRYVNSLPSQYAGSSRINADLVDDDGNVIRDPYQDEGE